MEAEANFREARSREAATAFSLLCLAPWPAAPTAREKALIASLRARVASLMLSEAEAPESSLSLFGPRAELLAVMSPL